MSKKATSDKMEELHGKLAEAFLDLITNGEIVDIGEGVKARVRPGAAVLNAARQFLKDNGIESDLGTPPEPMQQLAKRLPFAGDDEPVQRH